VRTIEGLSADGDVADLQQAFIRHNALQCGFCTPGMVMAAKELLQARPQATRAEVREWISGNYCRCTGYHAIVDAICETLAERAKQAAA
jgi:aerobic-type carbon monoxide dehydrogenase small subunit (CoxS/CutS family)